MASGDPVVQFLEIQFMGTSSPTPDIRTGGSTPAEKVPVLDFDDTAVEVVDYKAVLSGYGGGGLTFRIYWSATTATSGTVQWEIAIRRIADDAEDIDGSHTYVFNVTSVTTASASGEVDYATITFTDGADMDSWAEGEIAIIRIRRNPDGTDDMTGDAELWAVVGEET